MRLKYIRTYFFIGCFLFFGFCSETQNLPSIKGDYFSRKPPGSSPEIFAPKIICHGFHEHGIVFSPDGNEMFYVTADNRYSLYVIIHSKRENEIWSQPEVASFSGQFRDMEPCFSADGKRLYFSSARPLNKESDQPKDFDIWYVDRINGSWSEPVNLGSPVNTENTEVNPSVADNGNIYYQYNEGMGLKSDIYMSRYVNGYYLKPEKMKNGINTEFNEASPFISPDEGYLIFHSNRPGGIGSMDLYISFRKTDNSWTGPVNMGNTINTPAPESGPVVTNDGKYLFFSSYMTLHPQVFRGKSYSELIDLYRHPQNGYMTAYWVDTGIIEELRPKGE